MRIKLNRTVIQRIIIFVFLVSIYNSVFAQNEAGSKLKSHEIFVPHKLNLPPFSTDLQQNNSYNLSFQNYSAPTNSTFKLNENSSFTKGSFNQVKTEDYFLGLGSYEFYNNTFNYGISNNVSVDFGIGLARQNSILYAAKPNYQIGFQASVEFAVTSRLDAFIYGQYFTSPINKPKDFFDPMIYRNPLFLQSEVGAGIKRDYKHINTKFEINSIYENYTKQFAPVNSKISIGF
jgi:hypothetical protein